MIRKYLRETFATIEQGVRQPRSIGSMIRAGLINLCRSRGGGLYGLGYVATFVVLEAQAVALQIAESESGAATIAGLALEVVLRLGGDTLLNMLFAFIWPVWILRDLRGWGLLLLVVGFAGYNRLLRPLTERLVPELRRETQEEAKEEAQEETQEAEQGQC